jgi:DNA polymerase elongation subunit (family B)
MTVAGPEPLEIRRSPIDYEHYLTRQLQPVADAILPFMGDRLVDQPPADFVLTLKCKRDPIW